MQVTDFLSFTPESHAKKKLFDEINAIASEIASADRIPHSKVIGLMNCLDKLYLVTSEDRKAVVEHDRNFFAQTYHAYLTQGGYFQVQKEKGLAPLHYEYGGATYINGIPIGEKLGVTENVEMEG